MLGGGCGLCILVLAVLGGSVSLLVFSIMGLVQDWDKAQDCHGSALHIYMIVSLILSYISAANTSHAVRTEDTCPKICAFGTSFVLSTAMMIWGYIEVFDSACGDLKHTLLWDMGIVTASVHALMVLLCILAIVIPVCVAICDK